MYGLFLWTFTILIWHRTDWCVNIRDMFTMWVHPAEEHNILISVVYTKAAQYNHKILLSLHKNISSNRDTVHLFNLYLYSCHESWRIRYLQANSDTWYCYITSVRKTCAQQCIHTYYHWKLYWYAVYWCVVKINASFQALSFYESVLNLLHKVCRSQSDWLVVYICVRVYVSVVFGYIQSVK